MPESPYVVTASGDLQPMRRTRTLMLSPRRIASAWRQLFSPFMSLDLTSVTLDADAIDADLIEGFARGGHRVATSADVAVPSRAY